MSRTHCSHCGAPLRRGAPACPECGSDPQTGWADEETLHEAAFAPFDEEDYAEVVGSLPGVPASGEADLRRRVIGLIALLALAAFLLAYVL